MKTPQEIAAEVGELVDAKGKAYGNSTLKAPVFLALLWPDGVPTDRYYDMLVIVRVFDKLIRIAHDKDAFGENPWKDIAGYAIRALVDEAVQEVANGEGHEQAQPGV